MTEAAALKKPKSNLKLSAAVARSLREGTLWILSALALLLLLSFLTYHAHDPGYSDTGEPGPVGNWIGPAGAWLAGFFFFMFGRPAYLFPLMLAYAGWLVHKEHALPDAARESIPCCAPAASCSRCSPAAVWRPCIGTGPRFPTAPAACSASWSVKARSALSFLGATLLLLGIWLAGVALFLGVSWFGIMDQLGAWALAGSSGPRENRSEARTQLRTAA